MSESRSINFQPIEIYQDHAIAKALLVSLLKNGSLSLFIGAGVSMSSHEFPGWFELVQECTTNKSINNADITKDSPIDLLLRKMEEVSDACSTAEEYKSLVSDCLNKNYTSGYHHAQNMLLIAIGALSMSSRRGSISDIVTYNFDDLLEWYLNLHGFDTQVISKLPYLHRDSDVKIYHPHGFLPKATNYRQASHFVFDSYSYDLTIGNEKNPWYNLCQNILLNKVAIMVGLSSSDPAINSLIANTNSKLTEQGSPRPVAFLLNRTSSLDKSSDWYTKRGIVPIGFEDHDGIWDFLMQICQASA